MKKQKLTPKQAYIERVREALTLTSSKEMSKSDYLDALEEISGDVESMLEGAREEASAEE